MSVKLSRWSRLELSSERSSASLSLLDSLTCHLCQPVTPLHSTHYTAFPAAPVVSCSFIVLIFFRVWSITLHFSTCPWKVNCSEMGLLEMFHLIVHDTCTHGVCARRDNGDVTLSRAEDKQLWIGKKIRRVCLMCCFKCLHTSHVNWC